MSRRLLLVESLDEAVQVDVRLGPLAARTAEELARLPRVNQRPAAEAVVRRGLTHHQTQRLVAQVLERPEEERAAALTRIAGRLQARLWERPLAALGEPAARLVRDALAGLGPVLPRPANSPPARALRDG